ncbi:rho GTPase-activating protein 19-like [Sinocyclocheilus anshuiensis]|uniref:rho GTPase-activating protein 19-like n=1 Tax=Sinocyclocheilus anshuiensis TaxID=1608454 RepID=UPI0007BA31EE|nr:PREDICTED: rho GTPase-activating protein 19-like [Sinocyclocheilus anshuiensis]
MAAEKDTDVNKRDRRGTVCNVVISQESETGGSGDGRPPIIFNPDFFVEKLRHERPEAFTELVLSNITQLIHLPGAEFSQLLDEEPKTPNATAAGGFFRSFNFLKRKDKGVVFGMPLTEEGIAQIYQLIVFLSKNLHVEGLFRVPGNSLRQQTLREQLNSGADIAFSSGDFHPNDVATLLKSFLGELPEPLLTQRHLHAHLKITKLSLFDDHGSKTSLPDKERQIEALQLLLMLLPTANRSLLKLLLDLLYHTAKQQHKNRMSAHNLALMFAPHVIWPNNMNATDLQENLKKLNSGMAFLIKHSQKIFRAPVYLREHARLQFADTSMIHSKDDLELLSVSGSPFMSACKRSAARVRSDSDSHTEEALRELYRHVTHHMPNSAKKKKLIRQLGKQSTPGTPVNENTTPTSKKHMRSRSFGGLIKKKVLGSQPAADRRGKENISCDPVS